MRRMKKAAKRFSDIFVVIVLVAAAIACVATGVSAGGNTAPAPGRLNGDQLPLHFIENAAQLDAQVRYYVQGFDKTFYFTAQGVTVALEDRGALSDLARSASLAADPQGAVMERRRVALKLDFIGANAAAELLAEEPAPALISYFNGSQAKWQIGLKTYKKLVYRDLWPGIDLIYSGTARRLKYLFVVKPGADPDQIKLVYRGADSVQIDDDGRLAVRTALGAFHDDRPAAYQRESDQESQVTVAYQRGAAAEADSFAYGFYLGDYDRSLPLIIDPAILVYAGFMGGSAAERGNAIAVDAAGSAYITGEASSIASFPVNIGPDRTHNGGSDAFVAKVAADGETLIYAGFIGGAGTDRGKGIAVDGAGNAYVVGETDSGVNFPTAGGVDSSHNGGVDAFVAKVNAAGTALLYGGYIGGVNDDRGNAVALEQGCASNCAAYVTGETNSSEASFPDTGGPDLTHNFGVDAFVAKVDPTGSALLYAGYIGGFGTDRGKGIAVDGAGSAYVTGETDSSANSFPDGNGFGAVAGFDQVENGAVDAFIVKVNPAGAASCTLPMLAARTTTSAMPSRLSPAARQTAPPISPARQIRRKAPFLSPAVPIFFIMVRSMPSSQNLRPTVRRSFTPAISVAPAMIVAMLSRLMLRATPTSAARPTLIKARFQISSART